MLSAHVKDIDLEKLEKEIGQWAKSSSGRDTIQNAIREATEVVEKFREARFIDQKKLHEQVTL